MVHRKEGELCKPKEALCMTCYGLPHAVTGTHCRARRTDGSVCGQSAEPEVIEASDKSKQSNFLVSIYD